MSIHVGWAQSAGATVSDRPRSMAFPILFMVAHAPIALLIRQSPMIGWVHVFIVMMGGLLGVLQCQGIERVAFVGAYIAGSEVLWRMTRSNPYWETGKYALCALFLVAIYRSGRWRLPDFATLYFMLLLPSAFILLVQTNFKEARDGISFNLSGPLALLICVWFFHGLGLSRKDLQSLFVAMLAPIAGIATLTAFGIATKDMNFGHSSNFQASSGFGPNQVSAILGLGAIFALLYVIINNKESSRLKLVMIALSVWFMIQSVLTYSRGGLYNAVGSGLLAFPFLLKEPRRRLQILVMGGFLYLLGTTFIWPALNDFTGGTLEERYSNMNTTGRSDIAESEMALWDKHFVWGVGPGEAKGMRDDFSEAASHTEYSRLLAEHGVFGLVAIFLLLVMGGVAVWRQLTDAGRAMAVACVAWGLLYMTHAGMRTVAPSFLFGLAWARYYGGDSAPVHRVAEETYPA